jgi:hypothetical protein
MFMINHNVHYFRNSCEWIPIKPQLEANKKPDAASGGSSQNKTEVTSNMTNGTAGAGGWKTLEPATKRTSNTKRSDSGGGINLVSKTI